MQDMKRAADVPPPSSSSSSSGVPPMSSASLPFTPAVSLYELSTAAAAEPPAAAAAASSQPSWFGGLGGGANVFAQSSAVAQVQRVLQMVIVFMIQDVRHSPVLWMNGLQMELRVPITPAMCTLCDCVSVGPTGPTPTAPPYCHCRISDQHPRLCLRPRHLVRRRPPADRSCRTRSSCASRTPRDRRDSPRLVDRREGARRMHAHGAACVVFRPLVWQGDELGRAHPETRRLSRCRADEHCSRPRNQGEPRLWSVARALSRRARRQGQRQRDQGSSGRSRRLHVIFVFVVGGCRTVGWRGRVTGLVAVRIAREGR